MRLRQATTADVPEVVALMNAAFRGVGSTAGWTTEASYIDGDRTSTPLLLEEMKAKPEAALMLSRSEDTSALQGSVWLEPAGAGVWYLGSLTIDPNLQNAGAGRRLLETAEVWAQQHGAHTIRMKVINIRDTLIAWYIRRGYQLTGETEPFPYGDRRFGTPNRDDLSFVLLGKSLAKPIL